MGKLQVSRSILQKARERSILSEAERQAVSELLGDTTKGSVSADPARLPLPFLISLLDDPRLTANQRATVALQVHGMVDNRVDREEVYRITVESPVDFGSSFALLGRKTPNCEYFWNGRWYPIVVHVDFVKDESNVSRGVLLRANLSVCESEFYLQRYVYTELFTDDEGRSRQMTVLDVLHHFGFRRVEATPSEYNLKLVRAERISRQEGSVVMVRGPVLRLADTYWWNPVESLALGTPAAPRRAVIDSELEVPENRRGYFTPYSKDGEATSRLPFVRIFSLDKKCYVFADVDDIDDYEFDDQAMSKLHLPDEMVSVLTRVFNTPVADLFGDLIDGKHGGVVVLACGSPGVGKTLTAEVYAEETQRPLYVLELGELGTNVEQVEEKLGRVFTRVARWNAVLQFDECEIFLTSRGDDLERSAIVGIFLRLLDYYEGILFLTTNRPEVLDHAILSRVMLRLDYPQLDQAAREAVWQKMFAAAGLELNEGTFAELAEAEINGRQIRNLSRLARILHPNGSVSLDEMEDVLQYGCA